jgi:hypothetical protein
LESRKSWPRLNGVPSAVLIPVPTLALIPTAAGVKSKGTAEPKLARLVPSRCGCGGAGMDPGVANPIRRAAEERPREVAVAGEERKSRMLSTDLLLSIRVGGG